MDCRLEEVIRETFNIKTGEIKETWTSQDLPIWDSMGHLNLVMAIEREFNVKLEIEEMFSIRSLGDISEILKNKAVQLK